MRAVLEYGFTQLDLDRVAALVHPDNERSFHLLHKLGFIVAPPEAWHHVSETKPEPARLYCYSGHLRSCQQCASCLPARTALSHPAG